MEPTIRVGDIVVVMKASEFKVGDIIMWCSNPFYCVVHRVVEIDKNLAIIITKGDSNPSPDLPVRMNSVKGKVVAVIPREIPLVLLLIAFALGLVKRRDILRGVMRRDPITTITYGIILFIALALVIIIAFPMYALYHVSEYETPNIILSYLEYKNGSVIIKYTTSGVAKVLAIKECYLGASSGLLADCGGLELNSSSIVIDVPPNFLSTLNKEGMELFWVYVVADLSEKGKLVGNYTVRFTAQKLAVIATNNGTKLVLKNPNPFEIEYRIKIFYTNESMWKTREISGYVTGYGTVEIIVGNWRYAKYSVTYVLKGKEIVVQGWLRND